MDEKFIWTEEYSVQNEMIDGQHKTFFGITNDLIELASRKEIDRNELLDQVAKLGDYAFFHLGTEEDLFSKYGYSGAEHIAAHNMFRQEVTQMMDAVREDGVDIGLQARRTADFAGNWLKIHIETMDRQYAPFFTEKGLK
ncbi:MAG: hemerythrin family protein [Candidatus Colwellbacteria bacterium]|nr:hemerythrin family protein [Candidatus Colwellbacteria bacterium]